MQRSDMHFPVDFSLKRQNAFLCIFTIIKRNLQAHTHYVQRQLYLTATQHPATHTHYI